MKPTVVRFWMSAAASVVMLASAADLSAQDAPGPTDKKIAYSPYPTKNFPNRVYFGDTHLHTSYSQWLWRIPPYAIGGSASYWVIERVAAF